MLDVNGNLLGRSDNSFAEIAGDENLLTQAGQTIGTLQSRADEFTDFGAGGLYEDFKSTNPRDAGLRFVLPGTQSGGDARSVYFFRVRSASVNPDDAAGGLSSGGYKFQVRLREDQEFPGSVIRFADIRFANHGVHVQGLPGDSPLTGDAQENEDQTSGNLGFGFGFNTFTAANDTISRATGSFTSTAAPGLRPQNIGNLANTKNGVISVGGALAATRSDVDFYQMDLDFATFGNRVQSTVFDVDYADGSRPDTNLSIFYDPDGEFGPDEPRLVLFGQNANIAEDRTSPLGENDTLERLLRGSTGDGDAFIGPVSLPEGTYYTAITESTSIPDELTDNINVRREPINSVRRIFEDRIDAAAPSTASGPVFPELFTDASIAAGGFVSTTDRGTEPGHGVQQNFDGSNVGAVVPETILREGFFPIPGDIGGSPFSALDLSSLDFSVADNNEIGGDVLGGGFFGGGVSENTSTLIPHVTIDASMAGDAADFFQLVVPQDGTRVIVDVDRGWNPFQGMDDTDDATPAFLPDPNSIDTNLVILQAGATGLQFFTPQINDSDPNAGRAGSAPDDADGDGVVDLPLTSLDPFFDGVLDAGLYFFGVIDINTAVTIDNNGVLSITNNTLPLSGEYRVHISVEDQPLPTGIGGGNQSLFFNRAAGVNGQLVSESFDLSGYSADDQPRFYFNYLRNSGFTDSTSYTITSDQSPAGVTFTDLVNDSAWRQNIVNLNQFAGHTGVQVTFDYTSGLGTDGEGLYLDDFIVGFAERGETVFNARGGEDGFSFGFGNSGEYQLEIRTATEFARPAAFGGGQTLVQDFDTNDRHAQAITIAAPDGSQINDGDTFTISDGAISQRFEFTDDNVTNFSNLAISFASTDTAAEIAEKIRAAINQSSTLAVEAASASGIDVGAMTDNRLNLFGAINGSFESLASGAPAPATLNVGPDGDILLPAVLFNGVGDVNFARQQSQVIIENNVISDAHAIGIWSEPGDRDVDPEDLRRRASGGFFGGGFGFFGNDPFATTPITDANRHPFLEQPPVGNSFPGAARNLPTLNDSVVGGLAPGVVVRNNTVDQAGLAGIKVSGETRTFMLDGLDGIITPSICDGSTMAIDAGGTRVVFEFEDISGAPTMACGSGVVGGDGFVDGHVPIYFRRTDGGSYNNTGGAGERGNNGDAGYTSFELMLSIVESIRGSILVTNNSAELVRTYIGPSLSSRDEFAEQFARTNESFSTAAVYIEGASNVYFTGAYGKLRGNGGPFVSLAPVSEAVQPLARLVNNTIYGADGIESTFVGDPTEEGNDLLSEAVITHVGRAHTGPFIADAEIGDIPPGFVDPVNDVDFYQVELMVGDRLIVDIDTQGGNAPDTSVTIYNEFGVPQVLEVVNDVPITVNTEGVAPSHLDPESTVFTSNGNPGPLNDTGNTFDPFVDFTVLETGTYYVAVSSAGNVGFDPNSLSGRTEGVGGTGSYQIGLEAYVPRSVVLSLDDRNEAQVQNNLGTMAPALDGATFTVTQIPDLAPGTPNLPGGVTPVGNQVTFQFTLNSVITIGNNVAIPLLPQYRVPDIMRAVAEAVEGLQDTATQRDFPALPNHEFGNGPNGRTGPITRGRATALGGSQGDNLGITNLTARSHTGEFPLHYLLQNDTDWGFGFGVWPKENNNQDVKPAGTFTDGLASTELYVLFENIAEIELSQQAINAGLKLTPDAATPQFAQNADQLIPESGIWITGGASPTLLNNVIANAHQSVVVEETSFAGFGQLVEVFGDSYPKPSQVVLTGTAFQHDEPANTQIRFDLTWPVDVDDPLDVFDTRTSTDDVVGATNVADQADDFNFVIDNLDPLFVNAAGNDFLPATGSLLVDSAINSINDRDEFVTVKSAVGLPASNVLSPNRDVRSVLRADNPDVATPGAIGFSVFKDRGANELADFVGPVATTVVARDNDADGVDSDPATSFLNLTSGVLKEFRIQIRDTGDASDPFTGFGIDDRTIVVPEIEGLRTKGANITLFEDERLLIEEIDYTFNYDETKGIITLTPLAGVWEQERSYRIELNNQERTVLIAPDPSSVADGDQVSITDSDGGTLVFEFELGYQLFTPEPITLIVPEVGTNAGGLSDGDIFQINDGANPVVVFEFNSDSATLPDSVVVPLPDRATPTGEDELEAFLAEIAENIRAEVQNQIDAGLLDVDVRVINNRVIIGGEAGTTAITSGSGLQQLPRTLGLQVPAAGVGVGGIQDGDVFVVGNGSTSITFEFDTGNGLNLPTNAIVPVAAAAPPADVVTAIIDAINASDLGLSPSVGGNGLAVYLNLPLDGFADVPQGQLNLVGLSRPATDGDTIVITPTDNSGAITFEVNRTDEPDADGNPMDDGVTDPNVPINVTRATTADEFAGLVSNAIQQQGSIAGLSPNDLQVIMGGLLTVGGEEGLGFAVTGTSLEVTGSPAVTGASTIQVFGPLLLNLPLIGGGGILDGSVLVIQDVDGNDVIFEFNLNNTQPTVANSIPVPFDTFSTFDVVADNLVAAINGANIGVVAQNIGTAQVSLGRIDESRVNIDGIEDEDEPANSIPGLSGATLRRGIVGDGEVLTIRQGATSVTFEFEAAVGGGGTAPNNVPVAFQPGSTVGDVAISLAAAINNNRGNLRVDAVAELDANGIGTGQVFLNDQPGTVIEVLTAPTLNVIGVPGGATPIRISPAFSPNEVKQALITAINSVNEPGELPVTTLVAEDRGGSTFFVSNGEIFSGPITNFSLPAIADLAGNSLEANRNDLSTQFTILMPTVGLDYGDAPDPVLQFSGRYPTRNVNDGPRHVVDDQLFLGNFVDADVDGVPGTGANGDDFTIEISDTGVLFDTSVVDGAAIIDVAADLVPILDASDGDTITINTGVAQATLEFDINGRFEEDNFAIRPDDPTSRESIAAAIERAIAESPLEPADVRSTGGTVTVDGDDEDAVVFTSDTNPSGVLNHGVATPIEVSVTGAGILEAWIDFNADGDWDDPGEQIIPMPDNQIFGDLREELCPANLTGIASNIFADTGAASARNFCIVVPPTTPIPPTAVTTYARFRVSREGGLDPTGLALSGEVEDYPLTLLPGLPPQLNLTNVSYTVEEDLPLTALDVQGILTPTQADNGLLAGVVDPDGDVVRIFGEDVGTRDLFTPQGNRAGALTLESDGTFSFLPEGNFNGTTTFTARVTDIQLDPALQLVNSRAITVTINVEPTNDAPQLAPGVSEVVISREINEDEVQTFSIFDNGVEGLIGDKFIPGDPGDVNEESQPLIIQSAGSIRGTFLTSLGGTLAIVDGGQTVIYTPPADYNGDVPDTFTYVVADVPPAGQLSEVAADQGTVTIDFNAVNDPPRTTNDNYDASEDTALIIPINGDATLPGILDNDRPGPQDEIDEGQTISLVGGQFPKNTVQGGTVALEGDSLRYTPPALFSGLDIFTYEVRDSIGATATANVTINVGGVNNAPVFIGINGDPTQNSITRDESKLQAEQDAFDLTTWFNDPEDDPLTFTVTSDNLTVVNPNVIGDTLILEYPPFAFGSATLTVTARDPVGAETVQLVPVLVNNTPDPPSVIGTLNPLTGQEDDVVTGDLTGVFADPDGQPLQYSVARIGTTINPTPAQIALDPLVEAITFVGDELRIQLKPDQSGTVDLEVAATDGSFRVSDSFTLTVTPVADDPIAAADGYNVPVGSRLQIVNPNDGLLRNDTDADGETVTVDLSSVTTPSRGTVEVNADGTFTYISESGAVGQTDSFSYRVVDSTGRPSNTVDVTFTLNQSNFQNPLTDLSEDVNADGVISAIDALRIINFLSRALVGSTAISVPVNEIGTPPPDFYDANGDGRVSAGDALVVINKLRQSLISSEEFGSQAAAAVTSSFVGGSTAGLPVRNLEVVPAFENELDPHDAVLTGGFEIASTATDQAVGAIAEGDSGEPTNDSVDEALSLILDEINLNGELD